MFAEAQLQFNETKLNTNNDFCVFLTFSIQLVSKDRQDFECMAACDHMAYATGKDEHFASIQYDRRELELSHIEV